MFRQYGVHFVAVANNIDSDIQESSEFAPFMNIMNEWYLRDQSRKVEAAFAIKGKSGKHTTNRPVYGYRKDPADKDHWIIDEEAAAVGRYDKGRVSFNDDICATAKGYEMLTTRRIQKEGGVV